MGRKKPKTSSAFSPGKPGRVPKALPTELIAPLDAKPVFSFEYADRSFTGAGWSWPSGPDAETLLTFLCEAAQRTWKEIRAEQTGGKDRHRKHHEMSFADVCQAAQDRISALRLDETFEQFFRFRLSGKARLWGFVAGQVFHVLWWDADHSVYPTEP